MDSGYIPLHNLGVKIKKTNVKIVSEMLKFLR